MLFQILGLWLHLKEIFFLGLTVAEINIKGVQDERKKARKTKIALSLLHTFLHLAVFHEAFGQLYKSC